MRTVALVPARGGSKSVPRKNILSLGDHPLIAYSIAAGRMAPSIDRVIVTTDDEEIADVSRRYGAEVPFLRPAELARDDSGDEGWYNHYLDMLEEASVPLPELIVQLRPTTPLRQIEVIEAALAYMRRDEQATSLRSMHRTALTPYKLFKLEDGYAESFLTWEGVVEFSNLPRQAFPQTYAPNGLVDILRPELWRGQGLFHGAKIKIWETDPVPDIDVVADVDFARGQFRRTEYQPLVRFLDSC